MGFGAEYNLHLINKNLLNRVFYSPKNRPFTLNI